MCNIEQINSDLNTKKAEKHHDNVELKNETVPKESPFDQSRTGDLRMTIDITVRCDTNYTTKGFGGHCLDEENPASWYITSYYLV